MDLKWIQLHQWAEPSLMAKNKNGMYHKSYFTGGSNKSLSLITRKDNTFMLSNIQSYVLHWYHTYLLHQVMDRTEAIICQHFYWTDVINSVRKEVTNCGALSNIQNYQIRNMVNYQLSQPMEYHGIKYVYI